ncbi:Mce family protein [Gordonia effusa NBRC 100432]|uniref:Mce family protein n=1 Tax=Gordonia effusa NBRC 100432 TaxID=1077974 RepID=H0R5M4_9ACTN|nr:MCE family protein [Gordonia effusa]GAB20375.1 Mce family protein [Gordonia effusa NBRC 100432]
MQALARRMLAMPRTVLTRLVDPPAQTAAQRKRVDARWGISAVIVLAVLGLLTAGLYFLTPGKGEVKANFAEAGQIRTGDNVRVAGIPVGAVSGVKLAGDHVEVTMSVDRGTFIGSESSADVKMLTVVGGNYIDITSVGDQELGDRSIPVTRTSVPYSLTEVFQLAQPKISKIDASPLRETLVQLNDGFASNPGALRKNLTQVSSMLTNLNKKQDEFGAMLNLAADYSKTVNANGDVLTATARNLSLFISEYDNFGRRLNAAVFGLDGILAKVQGLFLSYRDGIDPLVRQIDSIGREFGPLLTRFTPMINQGRDLIKKLEGMVAPDGSIKIDQGNLVLASDFCVPMAGAGC